MNENLITKDLYYERTFDLIEDLFVLIWMLHPEDPDVYENEQTRILQNEWNLLKKPLLEAFSIREGIQLISEFEVNSESLA